MHVADRLSPFGATIFAQMTGLAIKHNAVNLSQGFPDFEGPPEVKQAAIDALHAGHNQYARSQGVPPLNEAIADFFATSGGFPVDPTDEITVTAGCTEAIAATMLGLINPGDEVILFEPYYDSYRATVSMAGGVPRFVTLNAPDFTFDEAQLRAAFTPKTKAILVNTPHNPTGRVFTREELTLIADLCKQHDVIAITDEVYERLVFENEHLRLASFDGMAERTITLSSLGKTFSYTGWKIGWAIARPDLTRAVRAAHQFLTYAQATPLQHAAAAALRMPQDYYDEFLEEYRQRRDLLCAGLAALGFTLRPPRGSYFVLADHTPFGFDDDVAFCKHLTTEIGVAAIPPTSFYENKNAGKNLVRFAFCKKIETLELALERMQDLKPIANA